MTLKEMILEVQKSFVDADSQNVCSLINELEGKISGGIFSPLIPTNKNPPLNHKTDLDKDLLLDYEHKSLYTDYIFSKLSLAEGDIEGSNAYSQLFNQKWKELAVFMRRKHRPYKKAAIYRRGIK